MPVTESQGDTINTNLNDLAKIIKPSEIAHLAANLDGLDQSERDTIASMSDAELTEALADTNPDFNGEDLVLTDIINAEVRRGATEVISDILGRPL